MTRKSILISVKVPKELANKLPLPGNGRSRFIIEAIAEKTGRRQNTAKWKPSSQRGERLAALLAKGRAERTPLLSESQIDAELSERRGRRF